MWLTQTVRVALNTNEFRESASKLNYLFTNIEMEFFGIFALVFVSIITSIYIYFKYSFEYWRSRGVPHDEPIIPYGNIKGIGKTIHPMHFYQKMYDKYKPTGAKMCGIYNFTHPVAVILDLGLVKNILIKDFASFSDRGMYYEK